jgi:hypothetical protein
MKRTKIVNSVGVIDILVIISYIRLNLKWSKMDILFAFVKKFHCIIK